MHPYHQGQLDFFCAAYAVVNAAAYLYELPLARARDLFAATMEELAALPDLWHAVLRNQTDFYWLPPYMLAQARRRSFPGLKAVQPFPDPTFRADTAKMAEAGERDPLTPDCFDLEGAELMRSTYDCDGLRRERVWAVLQDWFSQKPGARCVILRFRRYLPCSADPVVQHWTVADAMRGGELVFRDASRDPGAVFSLKQDSTDISAREGARTQLLVLEPPSILLLERGLR